MEAPAPRAKGLNNYSKTVIFSVWRPGILCVITGSWMRIENGRTASFLGFGVPLLRSEM